MKAADGPYVLDMHVRVSGYGTDQQAAQHAQRIRRLLGVALHTFVNVTNLAVERPTRKDNSARP